jgi:hypothetical protein
LSYRILRGMLELIRGVEFSAKHRVGNSFIRERKLPFCMVFGMILKLVKKSLSIECELLNMGHPPSKQAFSKARYNISHTGFKEVHEYTVNSAYGEEESIGGLWRGYRLIAADGSSIRLPDNEQIVSYFGRYKSNGTRGKMPTLGRVSLFVDLCTSMIINARLSAWDVGEQTLAKEQLPEVVTQMRELNQKSLLFIYDRGYPSIKFIRQHKELKVDFLFRLQKGMYKDLWSKVTAGETDFEFLINKNQKVRVLALILNTGEIEVLITSLFDKQKFTLTDISKVYVLRWQIEECFKRLKIVEELENFSGIYLEAILQEFYANIIMSNVLSIHIAEAQTPWNPDLIPEYRLNFSVIFGVMRHKLQQVVTGNFDPSDFIKQFKKLALRHKVKIRPDRHFSWQKVDVPKRYHLFRKTC